MTRVLNNPFLPARVHYVTQAGLFSGRGTVKHIARFLEEYGSTTPLVNPNILFGRNMEKAKGWFLKKVDSILEDVAEFQEDMEEVQVKTIIQKTSAYIFEVARRNYGGKYYWYEQLAQPILVTGQPDFEISLLALEKVKGRLKNGKEDNIPYFFQGYVDRVKKAKPGDKAMIV